MRVYAGGRVGEVERPLPRAYLCRKNPPFNGSWRVLSTRDSAGGACPTLTVRAHSSDLGALSTQQAGEHQTLNISKVTIDLMCATRSVCGNANAGAYGNVMHT